MTLNRVAVQSTPKMAAGGRKQKWRRLSELIDSARLPASQRARVYAGDVLISSITDDSRDVVFGDCFVAVSGDATSGRTHLDEALLRGARAVICEDEINLPQGVGSVRVHDARSALARLAAAFYGFAPGGPYADMRLLGVTGTNGKTTTCVLLQSILAAADRPAARLGTLEYDLVGETQPARWTTPPPTHFYAALARAAERGARHAVVEVSSHALAQSRCDGFRFACGVFTNLTGDHLDYHKTQDAYADAKKRLFDGLDADATAVVNADDPLARHMMRDCPARIVRFAVTRKDVLHAVIGRADIDGTQVTITTAAGAFDVNLQLPGLYNVSNALAATGAAMSMGVDVEAVRHGLEAVPYVRGRLQRVCDPIGRRAVFVDYAHTDDALVNVLCTLKPLTRNRLICVFGCGGDRDRDKRPRMAAAAGRFADRIIVTSDNPREEPPMNIINGILPGFSSEQRGETHIEPDRRKAIAYALSSADAGDTVLIAGKGHEDYQIIGTSRVHFDDVEEAARALAEGKAAGS